MISPLINHPETVYSEACVKLILNWEAFIENIVYLAEVKDIPNLAKHVERFPLYWQVRFYRDLYRKFGASLSETKIFVKWFKEHIELFDVGE